MLWGLLRILGVRANFQRVFEVLGHGLVFVPIVMMSFLVFMVPYVLVWIAGYTIFRLLGSGQILQAADVLLRETFVAAAFPSYCAVMLFAWRRELCRWWRR